MNKLSGGGPMVAPVEGWMRRHQEVTGNLDEAYDKADSSGKRFIESQQDMKSECLGALRFKLGEGSSIRIRPTQRLVKSRNGRWHWIKL